jgi:hypothetical protein
MSERDWSEEKGESNDQHYLVAEKERGLTVGSTESSNAHCNLSFSLFRFRNRSILLFTLASLLLFHPHPSLPFIHLSSRSLLCLVASYEIPQFPPDFLT